MVSQIEIFLCCRTIECLFYFSGKICSGGFSPCLKHPIGMAYVEKEFSKIGTELNAKAGKGVIPVTVSKMPFVPTNYKSSK